MHIGAARWVVSFRAKVRSTFNLLQLIGGHTMRLSAGLTSRRLTLSSRSRTASRTADGENL
jgi:hypothetical protein